MSDVFTATLSQMMVMLLCIVIGFILNKKKLSPEDTATVLSKLETYVLSPALILNTFSRYCTVDSLKKQYPLVLYCAIAIVIAIGLAYLLSPLFAKKGYNRCIYRYALTFGNFGFMGNAIVPAILGAEKLYEYMLFSLPAYIGVYTWGLAILIPRSTGKSNPLKNLLNPSMIAVALGVTLGLTGAAEYMPSFFNDTLAGLGSCMGPIAMVLTGFVIGDYSFKTLLQDKKVYAASVLRLLILPALFILMLKLLGANNTVLTMCLFVFGTPLGLNTVVFPASYGGDTATGASMAMISHVLGVITIPAMFALLNALIL